MFKAKATKTISLNNEIIKILEDVKYDDSFEAIKMFPDLFEKVSDKQMLFDNSSVTESSIKEVEPKIKPEVDKNISNRRTTSRNRNKNKGRK